MTVAPGHTSASSEEIFPEAIRRRDELPTLGNSFVTWEREAPASYEQFVW